MILSVNHLHKKFAKDLHHNLYYGALDMLTSKASRKSEQLRKHEFWGLKDVSFEMGKGEFLALVGPNGSGKTTLLRCITGVYPYDTGAVQWHHSPKIISLFAMKSGLHPLFSGLENIYLKGAMMGMSKKEVDDKMDFILQVSGLEHFLDMPLGNYSSGMRAKLAFGVAMATEPDAFLIDEGFAFSDMTFKIKAFHYLRQYVEEQGKSIIMATHQLGKIHRLANRMILLNKGQIQLDTKNIQHGMKTYIDMSTERAKGISDDTSIDNWFVDINKES